MQLKLTHNASQAFFSLSGTLVPSLLNLTTLALLSTSNEITAVATALILQSLFFLSFDFASAGTSKLGANKLFVENPHSLSSLDLVSCILGACFSLIASLAAVRLNIISDEFSTAAYLAPILTCTYGLSQAPLGFLRISGRNQVSLVVLATIALYRLFISYIFVHKYIDADFFITLLLLAEGLHGLAFFALKPSSFNLRGIAEFKSGLSAIFVNSELRGLATAGWASNSLSGVVKHSDTIVLAVLSTSDVVVLYRPLKSIINLVFNSATSLFLALIDRNESLFAKFSRVSRNNIATFTILFAIQAAISLMLPKALNLMNLDMPFSLRSIDLLILSSTSFFVLIHRFEYIYLMRLGAHREILSSAALDAVTLYLFLILLAPVFALTGAMLACLAASTCCFIYCTFAINHPIKQSK